MAEDRDKTLPLIDNGASATGAARPKRLSGTRRIIYIPLVFLLIFFGGISGLYFQPPALQAAFRALGLEPGGGTGTPIAVAMTQIEEGEELAVISEGDVVALGRIIPRGDVVTVSPPFGAGDARIAEFVVSEGDVVAEGTILATLDSLPRLESSINTARANLELAEASLAQTRESIRASRAEAEASLARSLATEEAAAAELARTTELIERGVATRATLDEVIARANEAARDVERNRATLSRYQVGSGTVQADIAVAEANVATAAASLEQAEIDREQGLIRAPIDGTILEIHLRRGERPGEAGILDIGDTSQMAVEAEVYQTLIGRVTIGDPVTIMAEALSDTLHGTVTSIGFEIGRQSITSDDPAANTDARVVDVVITLDEAGSAAAERFTNMQVITRIDAGRTAE